MAQRISIYLLGILTSDAALHAVKDLFLTVCDLLLLLGSRLP
jgi:hypothetical protein